MTVKTYNSNELRQNIYLYYDEQSREGMLIDAGCSPADITALTAAIKESSITVKAILLTHGHFDHITAADEMRNLTGAAVYCHEAEEPMLKDPALNLAVRFNSTIAVTPDMLLNDGDVLQFGNIELTVLHIPGHTLGGVCYYDKNNGNLFSGDVLFKKSVGRTDLPNGNTAALIDGIKTKLLSLPGSTRVYPGHGPGTTIGHEVEYNPFI